MGWPVGGRILEHSHAPGIATRRRRRAGPLESPPTLIELFVAFAKMSLAGFGGVLVWARRGIVDQHKWMTADEFNETFALCHFLPGPNIVNLTFVFGSRLRGLPGSIAAFSGLVGPPALIMVVMGGALSPLRRDRGVAAHSLRRGVCSHWFDARGGVPDDDAAAQAAGRHCAVGNDRGVHRDRRAATAPGGGIAGRHSARSPSPIGCGRKRHEFRRQSGRDAGLDLRHDVAVCRRWRQFGDPRNAPCCGRRESLADRQAIHRCLCHRAALARTERPDRHPDRLFGRGYLWGRWSQHWRCACRRRCWP